MQPKVQLLYRGHAELAEGPVWHQDALWWVNITAGTLNRFDPTKGTNMARAVGEYVGCAVPTPGKENCWWLAGHRRLLELNWATGEVQTLHDFPEMPRGMRFNDGKLDPNGRFWFGSLSLEGNAHQAALFKREIDGSVERVLEDVSLSNGLAWSEAGDRFFYVDTPTQELAVFDYDQTSGQLGPRQVLTRLEKSEGFPDGLCAGPDGELFLAMWGGSQILRISQKTGAIIEKVPMPVSQPSSVCVLPGQNLRLAVTSAWQDMKRNPLDGPTPDGSLFLIEWQ